LFRVARHLHAHLEPQAIYELLREHSHGCGRVVAEGEIIRQINCSRAAAWKPDHPEAFAHASELGRQIVPRPGTPPWPKADPERINSIATGGGGLYELWEQSPIRFEDGSSHAEEIIDAVFPGNPLLCCGKSDEVFATRCRQTWRGHLHRLAKIVPNPMLAPKGRTRDTGRLSEHTLEATAARVYLVVEFDFSEFARDGVTPSLWAPLVRDWQAAGVSVADASAALHLELAQRLPLVLVVHTGGKSLHGWYYAYARSDAVLRLFMAYAVSLGADPHTWCRSQFVRLPDGRRESGQRQVTYYFNVGNAVAL
jgi:hypothetical protein